LSLKVAAESVRAAIVSYPTLANGLPDEDFLKHPSCLWLPLVIGRLTIAVEFDNCGEIIQEYPRCVRWPWSRCIRFDTGNDAWREQVSIHADREEPKFSACLVSRVQ
jgi:hypothetical protein